jgi:menaquinone-dependent protoporphyrinogen IX oxidase
MMTVLVACSSQETETTKCDSTCADSLKGDSTMVVAKDSAVADSVVVEKK